MWAEDPSRARGGRGDAKAKQLSFVENSGLATFLSCVDAASSSVLSAWAKTESNSRKIQNFYFKIRNKTVSSSFEWFGGEARPTEP